MPDPYTLRVFVLEGEPDGVKIVGRLNWTGVGIAFPRSSWDRIAGRPEFTRAGVYVLSGTAENSSDDLPTIYIGQGEAIGRRLETHDGRKDFWDWGYAFVSANNTLNRAHVCWLEYALIQRAHAAARSHLDNGNQPSEPTLTESEQADTKAFLNEMLRILPGFGCSRLRGTPGDQDCGFITDVGCSRPK